MKKMNYLTSIRGIAAVIVILYHVKSSLLAHQFSSSLSFIYANGYLAVDLFLILSGFIICLKYSEIYQDRISQKDFFSFMAKRFARVFPLHAFIMISFLVIPLVIAVSGRPIPDNFGLEKFFIKLFMIDLWTHQEYFWNSWNTPSWSISGEFLAYLIFPFLAFAIHNLSIGMKIILYIFLLFLIAFIYEINNSLSLGDNISSLGLLRCTIGFSLGMFICYFYKEILKTKTNFSGFAKIAFVILTFIFILLSYNFSKNHYFAPACFSLFLFLILLFNSPMHQFLESRVLVYIGDISYSLYLNHILVLYVLTMIFLENNEKAGYGFILSYLLITVLVSSLTYKMVEIPARGWLCAKLAIIPKLQTRSKNA